MKETIVALLAWVVVACTATPEQESTTIQPATMSTLLMSESLTGLIVFNHEFDI